MQKLFLFLLPCFLTIQAFSGNDFEGTLIFTQNASEQIALAIKNGKIAVDPGKAGAPKIIIDSESGDLYATIQQGSINMVMKINFKSLGEIGGLTNFIGSTYSYVFGEEEAGENAEIEKMNETQTIDGKKCSKYLIKDSKHINTAWVTFDVPFNFASLLEMINVSKDLGELNNAMPVKGTIEEIETGDKTTYQINIKEEKIEDGVFELPPGYPVMDMTSQIKQMLQDSDTEQIKQTIGQMMQR